MSKMCNLNVGLLGGGSWGTTVASLVSRNAPVTIWARNPDTVEEINTRHTNETYLPGASLPEKLVATNDIHEAVSGADVVVMGIPSQKMRCFSPSTAPIPSLIHKLLSLRFTNSTWPWTRPGTRTASTRWATASSRRIQRAAEPGVVLAWVKATAPSAP